MFPTLPSTERFLALDDEFARPDDAGCVIVPVPFERTSSYGKGSRDGPGAILSASHQVELFDAGLEFEPHVAANGIVTLAPLRVDDCDGETLAGRVHGVCTHWLDAGKRVVTLAGEHTGAVGAIRAHAEKHDDLTVLQLDAHSDLRCIYEDSPWSHACAMARVLDFHAGLVQVGVRSQCGEEAALARERGIPVFGGESILQWEEDRIDWVREVIAATAPKVYVTFDCDVLDPSVMPATGTPEPGGLTWRQVDRLLDRLSAERQLVGMDVSELAPIPTLSHPQFTIARLVHRAIGYMFRLEPEAQNLR